MPSAPNLRLTVLVPREQASAHPSANSHDKQHQQDSASANFRTFLLVIKDPENVSLGDLANRIKDQWQELWPAEKCLEIKQLVNGAYPDTAFTARCSVADIWVDSGRREREGFDQDGIVRVIPVPSLSAPTLTQRHQRAASVFQDVEGAAREAKRKFFDGGIGPNDSLPRPRATTPSQNKEQTGPQHHQSKRARLTESVDPPSPSPAERRQTTTSSPVYYNGGRVPSFANPRGHRRHLTNDSPGSPEIGLGLGITASPIRNKASKDKETANGSQKPSAMPPPPPRYPLRGPTNSSPLESSSQDDSPLGTRKPAERPFNSVPRETSRNNDKRPRTRAAKKTSGSDKRSHHATPSSAAVTVPKLNSAQREILENDKKELQEVRNLLKDRKTNPECLIFLREMSDLHKEITNLKSGLGPGGTERRRLLDIARKRLGRRRKTLEKFRINGELREESDAHPTTSEDEDVGEGTGEGPDESSDEDLPKNNPKPPRVEKRDLSAEFAAARRISSLRAYSTGVKSGVRPQDHSDEEQDWHGVQVVIGDTGTKKASPATEASRARASQLNGDTRDTALELHETENEDNMTDSDGEDIQYDAEVTKVQQTSPMRTPSVFQGASPRNAPPTGAEHGDKTNGVDVNPAAKNLDPSEGAQLVAAIEQVPEQQHPPAKVGLLTQLLQQQREAMAKMFPFGSNRQTQDESYETSEDETSEDDSNDSDGDYKM